MALPSWEALAPQRALEADFKVGPWGAIWAPRSQEADFLVGFRGEFQAATQTGHRL